MISDNCCSENRVALINLDFIEWIRELFIYIGAQEFLLFIYCFEMPTEIIGFEAHAMFKKHKFLRVQN
jgi:hypothetical protein